MAPGLAREAAVWQAQGMPTRAERLFKRFAALCALLTIVALASAVTRSTAERVAWPGLLALYLTGVSYGLGEMARLYQRHRRRCRECLEGTGRHLRWWALRVILVLVVSVLPVLLLMPVLLGTG